MNNGRWFGKRTNVEIAMDARIESDGPVVQLRRNQRMVHVNRIRAWYATCGLQSCCMSTVVATCCLQTGIPPYIARPVLERLHNPLKRNVTHGGNV